MMVGSASAASAAAGAVISESRDVMNYGPTKRRGGMSARAVGLLAVVGLIGIPASAADVGPSFRNDVMAVLAKSGGSAGACHGNKSGKAGVQVSLRGQDPGWD